MNRLRRRWSAMRGLWRSVQVYHLDREHRRAMDALYAQFVQAGEVVFDVGAHVGDRTLSFRRLGARVVAVEPQQGPAAVIRCLSAFDPQTTVVRAACGDREGVLELRVNSRNPTVTTASGDFVAAAQGALGWEGQTWDRVVTVPMTTLDALARRFGDPAFIKIDVEGFEDAVLAGLSRPPRGLSFEFTTIQRDVAFRALERLEALAPYRFNVALGESQRLEMPEPVPGAAMRALIESLPAQANSGDVYATLPSFGRPAAPERTSA